MIQRRVTDYKKKFLYQKHTLESSYIATINAFAYAIEARDPNTRGHSERVATYAAWLGEYINLGSKRLKTMQYGCRLHDVGKIGVPDKILLKPGSLTMEERAQIELHPVYGAEILGDLKFINKGLLLILHHHERYDGKGYPYGLKKGAIPIEARIAAIADAFDAMTSNRLYRPALTIDHVIEEFKKNSGTQFDPELVKAFLKLLSTANQNTHCMKARRVSVTCERY